ILFLLAAASPAAAYYGYSKKAATELTLYGGGYFGGDIYTGSYSGLSRSVSVDDDWSYGGRLGYVFNGTVGLEFGYGHSDAGMTLGAGAGQLPTQLGQLTENRYELNLNLYTNPGPVRGYFTLGGGATDFSATFNGNLPVTGEAKASDTRFTSNIGLGIMFSKNEHVALRIDGRWRYTDTNVGGSSYYCDFYGFCYTYDNSYYGSGEVTGGLTFTLGKGD
ncbi:MAG: outer membrane beta-barrel protein, partial [Candidatus Eiseniibacteriota bacterium]